MAITECTACYSMRRPNMSPNFTECLVMIPEWPLRSDGGLAVRVELLIEQSVGERAH